MLTLIEDLGRIQISPKNKEIRRCGLFRCHCGNTKITTFRSFKNGDTKSCGCLLKAKNNEEILNIRKQNKRIRVCWNEMIRRCYNETSKAFNRYGGRGIKVCDEWKDFEKFKKWALLNGYENNLSIDRIDNDDGYNPFNCRWTDDFIQAQNKRAVRKNNTSGYKGVSYYPKNKKWGVNITVNKKTKFLGLYNTSNEGAIVYNDYVLKNNLNHTLNTI